MVQCSLYIPAFTAFSFLKQPRGFWVTRCHSAASCVFLAQPVPACQLFKPVSELVWVCALATSTEQGTIHICWTNKRFILQDLFPKQQQHKQLPFVEFCVPGTVLSPFHASSYLIRPKPHSE